MEPIHNIGLVHADCLPTPLTAEELAAIKAGDFVKIIRGGERFWVKVHAPYHPQSRSGEINNDLMRTAVHGLQCGDVITFEPSEVIQIMRAEEGN